MVSDGRPVFLRARLREVTAEAIGVQHRLERIIASRPSRTDEGHSRGRVDHSRPPWNAPAAHLVMELHAASREHERCFRRLLDLTARERGGGNDQTARAMNALVNLAEAVEGERVAEVNRWLGSWVSRARVVLGERDLPRRLPRQPDSPEPRCPYCGKMTLRFWASRGEVRCVNPACRDDEDQRPVARMEYSAVAMDWVLAWQDGVVGVPV